MARPRDRRRERRGRPPLPLRRALLRAPSRSGGDHRGGARAPALGGRRAPRATPGRAPRRAEPHRVHAPAHGPGGRAGRAPRARRPAPRTLRALLDAALLPEPAGHQGAPAGRRRPDAPGPHRPGLVHGARRADHGAAARGRHGAARAARARPRGSLQEHRLEGERAARAADGQGGRAGGAADALDPGRRERDDAGRRAGRAEARLRARSERRARSELRAPGSGRRAQGAGHWAEGAPQPATTRRMPLPAGASARVQVSPSSLQ